ncbi:hypothetical protein GCM10022251_46790 [Phytohabitans flavus]|uniref:YcxB family protein n=1 Tax=Phytohabitans flavus TaxID=1076124 RepID=UPI0031EC0409
MQIAFTAPRDREYARRLVRRSDRRQLFWSGYVAAAFVVFGAGSVITSDGGALGSGMGSVAVGACLAVGLLRGVSRSVNRLPEEWFEPRTYDITDDRVAWQSVHAGSSISWGLIERVEETRFAFLLWQKGGLPAWDLPLEAMTEAQREELREFVRRRSAPPPASQPAPQGDKPATQPGTGSLRPPAPGER